MEKEAAGAPDPPRQGTPVVRWCYTKFEDKDLVPAGDCVYKVEGEEICPDTGTKHWQCFAILKEKIRFTALRKRDVELGGKASHYEAAKGTPYLAAMYCMKGTLCRDRIVAVSLLRSGVTCWLRLKIVFGGKECVNFPISPFR